MKATEIFSPGSFPTETYIVRSDQDYEAKLRQALSISGQVVSLAGPSKSGKTVLVEKVVGIDLLITVSGARLKAPGDLWDAVLDWMESPSESQDVKKHTDKLSADLGVEGKTSVLGLMSGGMSAKAKVDTETGTEKRVTHRRRGALQVIKEIGRSDYVVLVDDFHYIPRDIQGDVAREIKDIVRKGVTICTATVAHRGDDVLRANPELRGRLQTIDLPYWESNDLIDIGSSGLPKLGVMIEPDALALIAEQAAGSPQLMQLLCLHLCFSLGATSTFSPARYFMLDEMALNAVFIDAASATDFRSMYDVLNCGPKLRGRERKIYTFVDGTEGDVYRCVLKAIAANPPILSLSYDELIRRSRGVCIGEFPPGSSISTSCEQMVVLAHEAFPNERSIDWDKEKEVLDIPDPYLSFYLRWSGRLAEKAE